MWKGTAPDPGGSEDSEGSNQELLDLKDQNEQQQVLIAQLKELLRKNDQSTTVTQEKVEEYANTLSRISARTKNRQKKEEGSSSDIIDQTVVVNTPSKGKMLLLRQQLEVNRVKLAERDKFQKGLEETVTQLKAQLDDSQQLLSQTPLNLSLSERSGSHATSSSEELYNLVLSKDRRISELHSRIQKLEANLIDLQENVKEKDGVIDAKTKAITLMTEDLSKKRKTTVDELDDRKEEMRIMQSNFVERETEMNQTVMKLQEELRLKNEEVGKLNHLNAEYQNKNKELVVLLEQTRNELETKTNSYSEETHSLNARLQELEDTNHKLSKQLQPLQRNSPQRSSKSGKKGQKNVRKENQDSQDSINELNSKIVELQKINESLISDNGKQSKDIVELQEILSSLREDYNKFRNDHDNEVQQLILTKENLQSQYEAKIQELTAQVSNLQTSQQETSEDKNREELSTLKKQLDESNKNMIKIKVQHKSKIKELNSKIDTLKNVSDAHAKVLELQDEIAKLREHLNAATEEKANLQLTLADIHINNDTTKRIQELESALKNQLENINTKQEMILTLQHENSTLKHEVQFVNERSAILSHAEGTYVATEMSSIHLEEQLDRLEAEKSQILQEKENLIKKHEDLLHEIELNKKEKQDLQSKLDSYIQENMELIDKLEKLSAEKVSSAESIEIVEGLTQQEKLELEAYHQNMELPAEDLKGSDENLNHNVELNDSVNRLTEETSDLLQKIELFTEERREVMEKLDILTTENNTLNSKIKEIESNSEILAETYEQLQNEKEELDQKLEHLENQNHELTRVVVALKEENSKLRENPKDTLEETENEKEGNSQIENTLLQVSDNKKQSQVNDEIDEFKSLVEIQREEIIDLKLQLLSNKDMSEANVDLNEKITSLQAQYESLLSENDKLNETCKINSELVHEKDAVESELRTTRNSLRELQDKLSSSIEELEHYKVILNESKNEVIHSADRITELQGVIESKDKDISGYESEVSHFKSVVEQLNSTISRLESEPENNAAIEQMNVQVQNLKETIDANLNQLRTYETELQKNSDTISELHAEIASLSAKILETERDLECKDRAIHILKSERDTAQEQVSGLRLQLLQKDGELRDTCGMLKQKCISLQEQIQGNSDLFEKIQQPLEDKIRDLEIKNQEQLNKLKKCVANLKKKTAECKELEDKYSASSERYAEQEAKCSEVGNKMKSLVAQLNDVENSLKSAEFQYSQKCAEYDDLVENVENLRRENSELLNMKQQNEIETEMFRSNESNALNLEINEKNEKILALSHQLETFQHSSQTNSNMFQTKLNELELYIETQSAELTSYKEKVNKLEEVLSTVEERRMSLEQKAAELGMQLEEKSNSFEEISHTEDILEQRLAALMAHDEMMDKKLAETVKENAELMSREKQLTDENEKLKIKLNNLTEKLFENTCTSEQLVNMENENLRLNMLITALENETKNIHSAYEQKLNQQRGEVDLMEAELQNQLQHLSDERKSLLMQCEQVSDQLQESTEKSVSLADEISLYKQKLEQQQTDFDAHLIECQNSQLEYVKELTLIKEYTREEINNLNKIIADKELQLEQVQEQSGQSAGFFDFKLNSATGDIQQSNTEDLTLVETNAELVKNDNRSEQQSSDAKQIPKGITDLSSEKGETISTFTWPQDLAAHPFEIISPEVKQISAVHENSKDELLRKIQTLEFLLYNMEKERDEILEKCSLLLSGEIERLTRQKSIEETANAVTELQSNASLYIYPHAQFESEIVQDVDIPITREERQQLHDLEFPATQHLDVMDSSSRRSVEEPIVAKSAYLCYNKEDSERAAGKFVQGVVDVFDDNDDGWGWGPEEGKLEEEHRYKVDNNPVNIQLRSQINYLEEKVRVLELERKDHLQELKESQVKYAKSIKKLKEFKVENDKLKKSQDFGNLDDAIQDEFKNQIAALEKKLKEVNMELEREKAEKGNLQKKIEVLQSANEKMADIKEKQDNELFSYRMQNRELTKKLEQLEWGSEGFDSPKKATEQVPISPTSPTESHSLLSQIEELTNTVKELQLDNEELQALLDEQRNMRITAKKERSESPLSENVKGEGEYMLLLTEKNQLIEQISLNIEERGKLQDLLNSAVRDKEDLHNQLISVLQQSKDCESILSKNSFSNQQQIQDLQREKQTLECQYSNKLVELENTRRTLQEENTKLRDQLQNTETNSHACLELNAQITELAGEREQLLKTLEEKKQCIEDLGTSLKSLENKKVECETIIKETESVRDENKTLSDALQQTNNKITSLTEEMKAKDADFEQKMSRTIEQLQSEWEEKVNQRGSNVAESWKLHVDSRENEFMQVTEALRKDINDLEEKCNALVNENNELRKNVDAEIRNEVDRISALQKQITDGEAYITQLTSLLHEKEQEVSSNQIKVTDLENALAQIRVDLQNKEIEISNLTNELEQKLQIIDGLTQKLNQTISECESERKDLLAFKEEHNSDKERIVELHSETRELKESIEQYRVEINERDSKCTELQTQLSHADTLKNQEIQILQQQLADVQGELNSKNLQSSNETELLQQINSMQEQVTNAKFHLQEKQFNIDSLTNQLQTANLNSEDREKQINKLKLEIDQYQTLLDEKEEDYTQNQRTWIEAECNYKETLMTKDADLQRSGLQIEDLQVQVENLTADFQRKSDQHGAIICDLEEKTSECESLQMKIEEQNQLSDVEDKQLSELKMIIENQVFKIEALNQELYQKSNDYDSLVAEMDVSRHTAPTDTEHTRLDKKISEPSDLAAKAELDLALYMLHQRDVRCEELTVELMQLLEERDTLQLKLSNAIREKEDLRDKCGLKKSESDPDSINETNTEAPISKTSPQNQASAIVPDATGTELVIEAEEHSQQERKSLDTKLSELKSVGYGKDKTLLDEQERRRQQQFVLMQQHRDIASLLPPEAAAQLMHDANYTLSRDVQSPSKVLLNWLWGRTTPKVDEI